jgi:hypothetical protein
MFPIKLWSFWLSSTILFAYSIVSFLPIHEFCWFHHHSSVFLDNVQHQQQEKQRQYQTKPLLYLKSCQYHNIQIKSRHTTTIPLFVSKEVSSSRRRIFQRSLLSMTTLLTTTLTTNVKSSHAKEEVSIELIHNAFEKVRNELLSGGVPYMKSLIENGKYDELLEFTKTYDQILRKSFMGKAKKFIMSSDEKEIATQLCNNVTFDLIGINRSVRSKSGNDNDMKYQSAVKYLAELQDDIEKFLALEPKQV